MGRPSTISPEVKNERRDLLMAAADFPPAAHLKPKHYAFLHRDVLQVVAEVFRKPGANPA